MLCNQQNIVVCICRILPIVLEYFYHPYLPKCLMPSGKPWLAVGLFSDVVWSSLVIH